MSKILIAEDDLLIAETVGLALLRSGHEVFHAATGSGALAAIAAERIDLVLLDLMLPVMHGLEVLRHLKGNPKHASIPVVILSARSRAKDLQAGREAGAVEYVTKPFGMKELLAVISRNLAATTVQRRTD